MNRNTALSFFMASTLVLSNTSADAEVHFSLNVVPNDVSDFSQGATWQMVARTDTPDSDGIVALVSFFDGGTLPLAGTVNPNIGHDILGGNLGINDLTDPNEPGYYEYLYGQDPGDGLVLGVGLPGGPSDLGPDFLGDSFWDNSSELAFGTIPDLNIIPVLLGVLANETFESVGGGIQAADIGVTVVRILPEPTTAGLALLACPTLLWRRRI